MENNYEKAKQCLEFFADKNPAIINELYNRLEMLKSEKNNENIKEHINILLEQLMIHHKYGKYSKEFNECKSAINRYAAEVAIDNSHPKEMRLYSNSVEKSKQASGNSTSNFIHQSPSNK